MFKSFRVVSFLLYIVVVKNVWCTKSLSEAKREILDHILPKNPNDILIAPGNATGGPTAVKVFLHVKSIENINDQKMELTTRMYVRQTWKDLRLQYNSNTDQIKSLNISDLNVIWTPDIYFPNLVKGYALDILRPNVFIRIFPDGTVLYSKYVSLTISCPMDLRRFPFDNQVCNLHVSTYGSTTDDVLLIWREGNPVTVTRNLHLTQFSLEYFSTYFGTAVVTTGKFNVLTVSFLFGRTSRYYVLCVFVPCTMLVVLSWISFLVDRKELNTRLLLGVSALLACAILVYDQNKHRAKLSYITLMDTYTGTCLAFIFISVVESTIIYLLGEKADADNLETPLSENGEVKGAKKYKKWLNKIPENADVIERWTRLIIPLAYVVFCFFYFYLANRNDMDELMSKETNYTVTYTANKT